MAIKEAFIFGTYYENVKKLAAIALILWIANIAYGYSHEYAHALIINAYGGHVYGIYVNLLGLDAATYHTKIDDPSGFLLLNMAGLLITTLFAFATLPLKFSPVTLFLSLRTTAYAVNYTPGTDIMAINMIFGNYSYIISAAIVSLNLICIAICLKPMLALRECKVPSSS
jgi:hypothetical protein